MLKRQLDSHMYCSAVLNNEEMEGTQVFINWWIDNVVHVHNEILVSHKNEILSFTN
jgi:hypothetical protein